nr:cell wall-binding repeat-containing protein [uncultured Peptostreptococcus sp.]
MKKIFKGMCGLTITASIFAGIMAPSAFAQGIMSNNISGSDRFSTAVKISESGWKQSDILILTNSSAVADSLSVAPLASRLKVPVLLTQSSSLNESTRTEISRLGAKKIIIVGGQNSISRGLEDSLRAGSFEVERIEGDSREETSINIANRLKELNTGGFEAAFLVNGHKGLADAAGIGAIAAKKGIPILFTSNTKLEDTRNKLNELGIDNAYVIGGNSSLGSDFDKITSGVERIAGSNRQETNLKMINKFSPNPNFIYLTDDGSIKNNRLIDAVLINSGIVASNVKANKEIEGEELEGPKKDSISNNLPEGAVMLVNSNKGLSFSQYKNLYNSINLKGITQVSGGDNLGASINNLKLLIENKGNSKADSSFVSLMKLENLILQYNIGGVKKDVLGSQFLTTAKIDPSFNIDYDMNMIQYTLKNLENDSVSGQNGDSYAYWKDGNVTIERQNQIKKIDIGYEANRLLSILKSGVSKFDISPKYLIKNDTNIPSNAVNLGKKYVEVDLTKQKMLLKENGYEKMATPVVTGNPNKGMATPPGIFKVNKMMKNAVLRGPGYASPVKYWVPFNGSIGIHDSYWQPVYGGSRYLYAGSHGCVNTPLANMSYLYSKINVGTPVIVHR